MFQFCKNSANSTGTRTLTGILFYKDYHVCVCALIKRVNKSRAGLQVAARNTEEGKLVFMG